MLKHLLVVAMFGVLSASLVAASCKPDQCCPKTSRLRDIETACSCPRPFPQLMRHLTLNSTERAEFPIVSPNMRKCGKDDEFFEFFAPRRPRATKKPKLLEDDDDVELLHADSESHVHIPGSRPSRRGRLLTCFQLCCDCCDETVQLTYQECAASHKKRVYDEVYMCCDGERGRRSRWEFYTLENGLFRHGEQTNAVAKCVDKKNKIRPGHAGPPGPPARAGPPGPPGPPGPDGKHGKKGHCDCDCSSGSYSSSSDSSSSKSSKSSRSSSSKSSKSSSSSDSSSHSSSHSKSSKSSSDSSSSKSSKSSASSSSKSSKSSEEDCDTPSTKRPRTRPTRPDGTRPRTRPSGTKRPRPSKSSSSSSSSHSHTHSHSTSSGGESTSVEHSHSHPSTSSHSHSSSSSDSKSSKSAKGSKRSKSSKSSSSDSSS